MADQGWRVVIRPALLCLGGWHGRSETPVEVVGETPKRYRIACPPGTMTVRLAGPRYLQAGQTALVPKYAIKFTNEKPSVVVVCKSESLKNLPRHCKRDTRHWVANSCRGPGACNCDCQDCVKAVDSGKAVSYPQKSENPKPQTYGHAQQ